MDISELLTFTKNSGASDLHLSSGCEPIIRLDGALKRIDAPPLTKDDVHEMVYDVLTDEQQAIYQENLELDFAIELEGVARFRVNCFNQYRGESAAFRVIPSEVQTLEDLGFPKIFGDMALKPHGLVLVTGPTGSGKSTTLAAMVDLINRKREAHILTVEDPIEFLHSNKKCLVHQREVHKHTHSFANALRSALREDPDVILVGEMRDLETTQLAITAAETGHLVLATLHTNNAAKTMDRIIDIFSAEQQSQIRAMLSESIQAVIAQTLLPRVGGGRAAAFEVMVATPAVRNLIREQKTFQIPSIIQTQAQHGMITMAHSLERLVAQGLVSKEFLVDAAEMDSLQERATDAAKKDKEDQPEDRDDFEEWRDRAASGGQ
ncbi:MAG: type IV pilus twitching motility protein PilT [Planctomycetes bacterium]|nr:type IV pilus twitching motility protein PilT [Planctomycetota bacterium]